MSGQEKIWDKEYSSNVSKWRKERLSLPNVLKGKRVLEVGVGNGKNLPAILKQRPRSVTAIDISFEALKSIKNPDKVALLKEDVARTSFRDGAFNAVVCYYVLNNMLEKDRKKAAKEINRILEEGGILLFEDFMEGDYRQSSQGKILEQRTLLRKNGLIEHFFTEYEIKSLFSSLKIIRSKINISSPIRSDKGAKRRIVSLVMKKV